MQWQGWADRPEQYTFHFQIYLFYSSGILSTILLMLFVLINTL